MLAKLERLVSKRAQEKYGSIYDMPISIVLTKFDQKLKSYVNESNPELAGAYFDDSNIKLIAKWNEINYKIKYNS